MVNLYLQTHSKKIMAEGHGGSLLVVSVLTFYSDILSSNPAEMHCWFKSVKMLDRNESKQKRPNRYRPFKEGPGGIEHFTNLDTYCPYFILINKGNTCP